MKSFYGMEIHEHLNFLIAFDTELAEIIMYLSTDVYSVFNARDNPGVGVVLLIYRQTEKGD